MCRRFKSPWARVLVAARSSRSAGLRGGPPVLTFTSACGGRAVIWIRRSCLRSKCRRLLSKPCSCSSILGSTLDVSGEMFWRRFVLVQLSAEKLPQRCADCPHKCPCREERRSQTDQRNRGGDDGMMRGKPGQADRSGVFSRTQGDVRDRLRAGGHGRAHS